MASCNETQISATNSGPSHKRTHHPHQNTKTPPYLSFTLTPFPSALSFSQVPLYTSPLAMTLTPLPCMRPLRHSPSYRSPFTLRQRRNEHRAGEPLCVGQKHTKKRTFHWRSLGSTATSIPQTFHVMGVVISFTHGTRGQRNKLMSTALRATSKKKTKNNTYRVLTRDLGSI